MAPPKCFFKRPEEFYSNGVTMMNPPKLVGYSSQQSPTDYSTNGKTSPKLIIKTEQIQRNTADPPDSPLDLSCKFNESGNSEIIKQLRNILLQQQLSNFNHTIPSNQCINLDRLFSQLPQKFNAAAQRDPNPKVYITPDLKSNISCYEQLRTIDPQHLSIDQIRDHCRHYSPHSMSESVRDNSSSETSSQFTVSQQIHRGNKRKVDSKVLRPFKLYKGNDSQGVMEALGINEEDEEWLRSIVEYKSVDDVFLFLTNCMNEATKPIDLTDDIIEKIKTKFGHIFQNCNTTISNPKMIRHPDMTPKELKTDEYWEKRRKNNDAAKRSREARRHKEDSLNSHCEKLQIENDCLRKEIEKVKLRIDEIKRSISGSLTAQ